jgi:hypothetical protein
MPPEVRLYKIAPPEWLKWNKSLSQMSRQVTQTPRKRDTDMGAEVKWLKISWLFRSAKSMLGQRVENGVFKFKCPVFRRSLQLFRSIPRFIDAQFFAFPFLYFLLPIEPRIIKFSIRKIYWKKRLRFLRKILRFKPSPLICIEPVVLLMNLSYTTILRLNFIILGSIGRRK